MPTIMTHAAIPLAMAWALGPAGVPKSLIATGVVLAMIPDADVIGFGLGIDYADTWGHRGASHAILTAAIVAGLLVAVMRPARLGLAFAFLALAMASHGILDAFTSGGLGPALWWPVDDARVFAPVRPIRVSPIGLGFFSSRGLVVLASEALWVWLPAFALAAAVRGLRTYRN
jgi:inner membrane protein